MNITLKVDTERLTFGDLLALEDAQEGKRPFHGLGEIVSRFMVDENDKYLDADKAFELLKSLSMNDINDLIQQFAQSVTEAQKSAVPLPKGGS